MTAYEFDLLMQRHKNDVRWVEAMSAVQPWVFAEAHRDAKKRRKPYSLFDWTITGLTKPEPKKKKRDPAALFNFISGSLRALGGVDDGNSSR